MDSGLRAPRTQRQSHRFCVCVCVSSLEQIQLDFVEMLRVRDETRRVRLVETLRKQKAEEEEEEEEGEPVTFKRNERRRGTESRVEPRGNMKEEQDMVFAPEQTTSTQGPASGSSGSDDTNPNVRHECHEPKVFIFLLSSEDAQRYSK